MLASIIIVVVHLLPPGILDAMGRCSDVVSDISPDILRGIEHVVFSLLLN